MLCFGVQQRGQCRRSGRLAESLKARTRRGGRPRTRRAERKTGMKVRYSKIVVCLLGTFDDNKGSGNVSTKYLRESCL